MTARSPGKRAAFACVTLCLVVGSTVALDRAFGRIAPLPEAGGGLLFDPYSRVLYETPEFTTFVSVNALGFRGAAFPVERTDGVPRVLAIGDSFTYGWGVDVAEAWPAVLEQLLRRRGGAVEVANLGRPGGEPRSYARVAERAVPLLQPDLMLLALLQGDDLLALEDKNGAAQAAHLVRGPPVVIRADVREAFLSFIGRVMPWLYPNLTQHLRLWHPHRAAEQWQVMAAAIQVGFDDVQRQRFARLDPVVRHLFIAGQLNPALILHAVTDPLAYVRHLDLDAPETRAVISHLQDAFARVKTVAERRGIRVLVVPVPAGVYVNRLAYAGHERIGYRLRPDLLETDAMDRAIQQAAQATGLSFLSVTAEFRAHADERLFFEFDGHFNAAGHALFAEQVAPGVAALLAGDEAALSPRSVP